MSEPRKLPAQAKRVETGVIQFGDDWPGVFIRGDNAAYYALALRTILESPGEDVMARVVVQSLLETMSEAFEK